MKSTRLNEDIDRAVREYVTFNWNVRKCSYALEFYRPEKEHLTWKSDGFNGLATLFERLDKLGRVGFTDLQIFKVSVCT